MTEGFTKAAPGKVFPLVSRELSGRRVCPEHLPTMAMSDSITPPRDLLASSASGMNSLPSLTCWSYLTWRWREAIPIFHLCCSVCPCFLHLADLCNHLRSLKQKQKPITPFILPGTDPDKQSLRDGLKESVLLKASHVILMQLVCELTVWELLI